MGRGEGWLSPVILFLLPLAAVLLIQALATSKTMLFMNISPQFLEAAFFLELLLIVILILRDRPGIPPARWTLIAGLLFFAFALLYSAYYSIIYDDAFITYRYAHNLVAGHGLVFNPGEFVEGYSNLLWTLLLAILYFPLRWLGVQLPLISLFLSFAALGVLVLVVRRIFIRNGFTHAPWYFLLLLGVNPFFAFWLYGGIETIAVAALLMTGYWLILAERERHLPVVGALLILLRADGFVYYFLLLAVIVLDHLLLAGFNWATVRELARRYWKALFIPVAVLLLQVGFRLLYYGYPLPNTFYAKVGSALTPRLANGLDYVMEFFSAGAWLFLSLLAIFALLEKRITKRFLLTPFLLLTNLYFIYLGGDSLIHFRFVTHVLPFYVLIAVWLLEFLAQQLNARQLKLLLVPLLLSFFLMGGHNLYFSYRYQFKGWYPLEKKREQYTIMATLGRYLSTHHHRASIAMGAIGIIPYIATDMKVIDILGLVDTHTAHLPESRTDFHIGHNKWDIPYVLKQQPDFIIPPAHFFDQHPGDNVRSDFLYGRDLFDSIEFHRDYKPSIKKIGPTYYLMFIRRDRSGW